MTILPICWLGRLILPATEDSWCNGARNIYLLHILLPQILEEKRTQSRAWEKSVVQVRLK